MGAGLSVTILGTIRLGLTGRSGRAGPSRRAVPATGSSGQAETDLALDTHPVSHEGRASPRVRHTVDDHEAIEADTHPAINTPRGTGGGQARPEPFLGDEHGGDRFAGEGPGRASVEEDLELGPASDPVFWPKGKAPAMERPHCSSCPGSSW